MKIEIKPLVWSADMEADGVGGEYVVYENIRSRDYGVVLMNSGSSDIWRIDGAKSAEEAMFFANEHHKKRVPNLIIIKQ